MFYITSKIYIFNGRDLLQDSKHISFAMKSNFTMNMAKGKRERTRNAF